MDEKMTLSLTLNVVVHDVRTLQSKSTSTTTWCTSAVNQSTPIRRVNNKTINTQRAAGSTTEMTGGISSCSSLINNNENRSSCTADNVNNGANVVHSRAAGTDWASASALPSYNPTKSLLMLISSRAMTTLYELLNNQSYFVTYFCLLSLNTVTGVS